MDKEQFDALMAAIGGIDTRLKKVEQDRIEAASVADKVAQHAKSLKDCAAAMAAAGLGNHATRGHARILEHMADTMMAEAYQGRLPSEYSGMSFYAGADNRQQLTVDAAAKEAHDKEIKELKDGLAAANTIIKDLQAQAQKNGAPERKTLPSRIQSLMAKGSLEMPANGKFTITGIDAALKGTSLNPQERLEVKIGLDRQGLIEKAAA